MYYSYILKCADETLYSGCTTDVEARLHAHNNLKSGAHYTKIRRPVVLVHVQKFRSLAKARAREAEVKRMTREEKEKLVTNNIFLPKQKKK